jgi:hypothetical protein
MTTLSLPLMLIAIGHVDVIDDGPLVGVGAQSLPTPASH